MLDLEFDDSCALGTVVPLTPAGEAFLAPYRPKAWALYFSTKTQRPIGLVFDRDDRKSSDAMDDLYHAARAAGLNIN